MKALVGAFNQEKALVGAFSVIVQPVVEPEVAHPLLEILRGHHWHMGTCGQVGVGFILASCETAGKIPSDTFPEVRQF